MNAEDSKRHSYGDDLIQRIAAILEESGVEGSDDPPLRYVAERVRELFALGGVD